MANLEKKQPSEEYKKIRCLFELFGFVTSGELTWQEVDRFMLDLVFEEMKAARDRDDVILVKEFWQNAYSLCITAVRLGINEFDDWDS